MKQIQVSLAVAGFLLATASAFAQSTVPVVTHVVDPHGNPIAGASVYVSQMEYFGVRKLTTDSNGNFTNDISVNVRGEPPIQCVVIAKDYAVGGCVLDPEGNHIITLTSPMKIHGTVTDPSLRPLAGVTVEASTLMYESGGYGDVTTDAPGMDKGLSAKTDQDGNFTIGGLPRNAGIDVSINDPRYIVSDSITDAGATRVPLLVAAPGVDIIGRVLLPNGKPAAGVHVQASSEMIDQGWRINENETDSRGFYRITGLQAGEYYITVELTDAQGVKWTSRAHVLIRAAAGKPTRVSNIKLKPASKKHDGT